MKRVFLLFLAVLLACGGPVPAKSDPALVVGQGNAQDGGLGVASGGEASEEDAAVPIGLDDAVRGQRLALVTLVVFSDFQCPFCSRHEQTLSRLEESYGPDKVRIVFKNNPLPFHQYAMLAAETGQGVLATAGQDAFWRFHDMVFREQNKMSPELISAAATAAGADGRLIGEGLKGNRWTAKIERDRKLAETLDASGTPMTFVNGVKLSGAQSYDAFKAVVDAALEDAKSLVGRGVPRDQVYARLATANAKKSADKKDDDDDDSPPEDSKTVFKVPATGPVRGPANALVTIIEFSDFECPYCKRAEPTLDRIRKEYGDKVRILWRDMPLRYHQRAEPAAQLARAARAQKGDAAFWQVHDLLFAASPKLEDSELERIAGEAKLDVAKAMASVKSHQFGKGIETDLDEGDDFLASSTPHFFVNGRRVAGAKGFDYFKPIIDEELARAEALTRKGTSMPALYDALVKDGKGPAEPERKSLPDAATPSPFRGAANAKVVIQEVADFQCPYCKKADATIEELLKAYPGKIKVVWRDHPLPFHPEAGLAGEAAREAFAQKGNEGFAKMAKLMFDNQQALKRDDLDGYAKTAGLDMKKFAAALDNHTHKPTLDAEMKTTVDAGFHATPSFLVGPYFISGAQPLQKFKRLVEKALNPPPAPIAAKAQPPGPSSLVIKDLAPGSGAAVKAGDKVKVHYTGTLMDGTEFDSSRSRGPFEFKVGAGHVIKGWDQGLIGMKVGGKRKLTIPADLAYGDRGVGKIPPKSALQFEIELLGIE